MDFMEAIKVFAEADQVSKATMEFTKEICRIADRFGRDRNTVARQAATGILSMIDELGLEDLNTEESEK